MPSYAYVYDGDVERVLLDRTLVVLVILSVCMYAFI